MITERRVRRSRALVTAPTIEPLTLAEVRRHLRVDSVNAEPVPTAPTVALISPAVAGNVDNGAHRYRLTFVTADGETDGGAISSAVTVADKTVIGKVSLTAIPLGGTRVTSRKIYRTTAGGSTYLLLATIADNTTTVYTDNIADASLGASVPVTNTTGDPELLDLLSTARAHLENRFGRAFLTQTWRLTLDQFPCEEWIKLPMPTLQSVTSISYIDANGATQTLDPSVYAVDVDAFPGRVQLKYGQSWPSTRDDYNAVTITFVAGFTAAALVPMNWKHALKLLIGHWYVNREPINIGNITTPLAETIDALMMPDRCLELG
jgi:uncharacterized phiE125 gp8 family phage protein